MFFWTMLLGTAPYSFITTAAGTIINEIDRVQDVLKVKHLVTIGLISCVAVALPLLRRRLGVAKKIE